MYVVVPPPSAKLRKALFLVFLACWGLSRRRARRCRTEGRYCRCCIPCRVGNSASSVVSGVAGALVEREVYLSAQRHHLSVSPLRGFSLLLFFSQRSSQNSPKYPRGAVVAKHEGTLDAEKEKYMGKFIYYLYSEDSFIRPNLLLGHLQYQSGVSTYGRQQYSLPTKDPHAHACMQRIIETSYLRVQCYNKLSTEHVRSLL